MRPLVLAVAVVMVAVFFAAIPASATVPTAGVHASGGPTVPVLTIRVIGEQVGANYRFIPEVILIPQVPIVMNITFYNNQTVAEKIQHTFTINDNKANPVIDTGLVSPQVNVTFQFTINSMTNITFSNQTVTNRSFTPGPAPTASPTDNGTIQWYCIPHVGLGMTGTIMLASAVPTTGQAEKGIFLRAYWIGMIGIASMIVWVGISYYVIKSSTPRFKDHREHLRKGLP